MRKRCRGFYYRVGCTHGSPNPFIVGHIRILFATRLQRADDLVQLEAQQQQALNVACLHRRRWVAHAIHRCLFYANATAVAAISAPVACGK